MVERLASYQQLRAKDLEAGGVLLGRHLRESPHKVVDEVTEPMQGDRRSRYHFTRGKVNHQRRIDEAWESSRGTCVYLGEWHTHPEPVPNPSPVDLNDWHRRLRTDQFDSDTLYFIIVGTSAIRAWEGHRESLTISPLKVR
ncbi:Mov34/MPN/PAD-1 family protein [Sorangium sp. So ce590]|uniref:Mov34/MPN/PAD-1 family protein n=1 Tax=Sorangium sp. So ce590 TaxID=3133317 RepID=UPI003F602799